MKKLKRKTVMPAIEVLVGTNYVDILNQKHAIEELLAETRAADQKSAATDTVTLLLNLMAENPKSSLGLDSLAVALRIGLTFYPDFDVAQRLCQTAARCGYHQNFPELPKRLLNRAPNAEEIILLISAFADKIGNQERGAKQKLEYLANAFLPKILAEMELRRI